MTDPTPSRPGPRSSEGLLIDASVLLELVIDGDSRVAADRVIDRIVANGDLLLITAAHGLVEAVNALRRLVRRGQVDATRGTIALTALLELDLLLDPPSPRLSRAWELRDTMTAYDAAYAAAAEAYELPLITTDTRLLRACATAGIPAQHLDEPLPT